MSRELPSTCANAPVDINKPVCKEPAPALILPGLTQVKMTAPAASTSHTQADLNTYLVGNE